MIVTLPQANRLRPASNTVSSPATSSTVSSPVIPSPASARQAVIAREWRAHERQTAATLWRSVMLENLGNDAPENFRWRAMSEPVNGVGGDFCITNQPWMLLGDISGKGVPAAVFSCMFAAAARLAVQEDDVAAALERAMYADLERTGMFCTLFAAKLTADGRINYVNLGHPPALIYRAKTQTFERLAATATPLGTTRHGKHTPNEIQLEPDDQIIVYSDGVTEAFRDGPNIETRPELLEFARLEIELFGETRLRDAIRGSQSPDETLQSIKQSLHGWSVTDDLCVIAAQYRPEFNKPETVNPEP
jgi:phosphoserine phosphatase RsbU/P